VKLSDVLGFAQQKKLWQILTHRNFKFYHCDYDQSTKSYGSITGWNFGSYAFAETFVCMRAIEEFDFSWAYCFVAEVPYC